jgi:hypothetical protein
MDRFDKNDIGKSQSIWTDSKMETAGSPVHGRTSDQCTPSELTEVPNTEGCVGSMLELLFGANVPIILNLQQDSSSGGSTTTTTITLPAIATDEAL